MIVDSHFDVEVTSPICARSLVSSQTRCALEKITKNGREVKERLFLVWYAYRKCLQTSCSNTWHATRPN